MKHVFVESNWVFAYVEPEYRRTPAAEQLVGRAERGELVLHVPSICLREGAESVRRKCKPSQDKALGDFRRLLRGKKELSDEDSRVIVQFLESFKRIVNDDIAKIDERLDALSAIPGIDAFPLSEAMLERVLKLRHVDEVSQMKPFDEAILAAVIVRAETLQEDGVADITFCVLDSDLWPLNKKDEPHPALKALYESAGVKVIRDFNVP